MFNTLLRTMLLALASLAICVTVFTGAEAQMLGAPPTAAPTTSVEVQALPSLEKPIIALNPDKATAAYLARVSDSAKARSNAYVNGGYLIQLVGVLYVLAIMGLLLWLKISARLRSFAQSVTRSRFWQIPIYFVLFFTITTLAIFPLTLYEDFFREHAYGLSNQLITQWLGDFGIGFATSLLMFTILVTLLYVIIRNARRGWWLWGTGLAIAFAAFAMMIYPVFLAPLLNHYEPMADGPVKQQVLSLARANGIPTNDVFVFDSSRQSNRISANVAGLFGTTRIALTDTLLSRTSPAETKAVLGHEMGHYVLGHTTSGLLWFSLVLLVGFWFANAAFHILTSLFGGNWDVRTIDDPAGLPVLYAAFTVFLLLVTPVTNTISRTQEAQADIFGLNAARQPDAFATVTLKLGEYRKLNPSHWEEDLLFDHPSGRSRIAMAMLWKKEHLADPDIKRGPVSPQ